MMDAPKKISECEHVAEYFVERIQYAAERLDWRNVVVNKVHVLAEIDQMLTDLYFNGLR